MEGQRPKPLNQYGTAYNRRAQPRKGGGGGRPVWVDRFVPTKNNLKPDMIQLLYGEYTVQVPNKDGKELETMKLPWFPWINHYDTRHERNAVCSAGPWHNDRKRRSECHGCNIFFSSMAADPVTGKKKKGYMDKRSTTSLSVIHYYPYHRVEQLDRETGDVRKNSSTGEPFWDWSACQGDDCPHCAAGKLTISAKKLHWDMGDSHFKTLMEKDDFIRTCCRSCKSRESITWDAYVCGNEDCENPFFVNGQTKMPLKDIMNAVSESMLCPRCGKVSVPTQYTKCTKCDSPDPLTIFDVRLRVRRQELNNNGTQLMIDEWEPAPEIWIPDDVRAFDPKMADDLIVPMDLPKIFTPTDLKAQIALFGPGPVQQSGETTVRTPVADEYKR